MYKEHMKTFTIRANKDEFEIADTGLSLWDNQGYFLTESSDERELINDSRGDADKVLFECDTKHYPKGTRIVFTKDGDLVLKPIPESLRAELKALIGDVEIDLDEPIEGDVDL